LLNIKSLATIIASAYYNLTFWYMTITGKALRAALRLNPIKKIRTGFKPQPWRPKSARSAA
jgi:hypothetical protein